MKKSTLGKLTRVHTTREGVRYAFSSRHGWLRWFNSELGATCSGWLPCARKGERRAS